MQSNVFRKVALDRLSSPEQLDQLMRVTTPRAWLALIAIGVLLLFALVWSIVGTLPTKVNGHGILITSGGLADVSSVGEGQIESLQVDVGDRVKLGQVVAVIAQPELSEQIEKAKARLLELEAQHEQLAKFGSQDTTLRTALVAQEKTALREALASAQSRSSFLAETLATQKELHAKGLITKTKLGATRQDLMRAREDIQRIRGQLKRSSVSALEAEGRRESELRTSEIRLAEAERSLASLHERLALSSRVVSPYEGRVTELRAKEGDLVQSGSPIVNLELGGGEDLTAVAYVPAADGKKVKPGMQVQVSPSTVKREEYGVMVGTVKSVAEFPSTRRGIMSLFDNEELVASFLSRTGGTPIEIRVELERAPDSVSGYRWSSRRGPPIRVTAGTPADASITVRTQRPISLVVPLFREYLGV